MVICRLGIINTVWATGFVGLAYLLALLFATGGSTVATDDTAISTSATINVFISACEWATIQCYCTTPYSSLTL